MHRSVLGTVGSPLVQVASPPGSVVAAKLESKNPGGSAKDRPAVAMIEAAEAAGDLTPGDGIVEPTSGNTGIGIAMVGAAKGYDVTIVMPASKSPERQRVMRAYGATLELVEGDISDAKDRADELEREEGAVQLGQFDNDANPEAHYRTTGSEILGQIGDHEVDALVAGVGTGGTLTGIGRRLREAFPEMEIVAVEPAESAVLSGDAPSNDAFQGMGPGFVSPNLDVDLLDDVITVSIDEAEAECRRLAREEGLLVGQSSAASNLAAQQVAERLATDGDCPGPDPTTNLLGRDPNPDSDAASNAATDSDTASNADSDSGTAPNAATDSDTASNAATDSDTASNADSDSTPDVDSGSDGDPIPTDCPLVVTVFWDSGERYMSTGLFDE